MATDDTNDDFEAEARKIGEFAAEAAAQESVRLGIGFEPGIIGQAIYDNLTKVVPALVDVGDAFAKRGLDEFGVMMVKCGVACAGVMAVRRLHKEGKSKPIGDLMPKSQAMFDELIRQLVNQMPTNMGRRTEPSRN